MIHDEDRLRREMFPPKTGLVRAEEPMRMPLSQDHIHPQVSSPPQFAGQQLAQLTAGSMAPTGLVSFNNQRASGVAEPVDIDAQCSARVEPHSSFAVPRFDQPQPSAFPAAPYENF